MKRRSLLASFVALLATPVLPKSWVTSAQTYTETYVSYIFRNPKTQPGLDKFFDIHTYVGAGIATTVQHSIGWKPEYVIVKNTSKQSDWVILQKDEFDKIPCSAGDNHIMYAFSEKSGMSYEEAKSKLS